MKFCTTLKPVSVNSPCRVIEFFYVKIFILFPEFFESNFLYNAIMSR